MDQVNLYLHLVRTAIDDLYLEPFYEQAYEDQKMDRMLSEMERLNEKLDQREISMNDIFDDLKLLPRGKQVRISRKTVLR